MPKIKVAIVGVGNCASAFVQGLLYYGKLEKEEDCIGLRNPVLGGFAPRDIQVVAAFDVDDRKVGKDLAEAIFAAPNNAPKVIGVPVTNVKVDKGSLLDGVGRYTKDVVKISGAADMDVSRILKGAGAEIVLNLLPSGATKASQWYAEQALSAGCAFINATPNFIASDESWAKRFEEAKLPLAGDDLVDQLDQLPCTRLCYSCCR